MKTILEKILTEPGMRTAGAVDALALMTENLEPWR